MLQTDSNDTNGPEEKNQIFQHHKNPNVIFCVSAA